MAWYYVKNGGTAVGDAGRYASQQTGSFAALGAANYYNDISAAIAATTSPISNDFINFSDAHNFAAVAAITYTGLISNPFLIVCVDDLNIDTARTSSNRGFEGSTSSSVDVAFNNIFISGLSLQTGDDMIITGNNIIQDSVLDLSGAGDRMTLAADGSSLTLINTTINMATSSSTITNINGGSGLYFYGSTVTGTPVTLVTGGGVGGGYCVKASASDFTAVTGTLMSNVGSDAGTDDAIDVVFDMCKIAAGVAFTNETFKSYNQRALFTRCSDSSAAAEYQYHLHAFGGDVDDDSAIFRNEDEAFTESNQKISYKIVTNSDASLGSPLWFDFPVLRYSKLATGATDTLSFYITSNTALTNKDIYIEISYPDGTNKQTPNFLTSAPSTVGGTLDLMATGTTLTTDGTSTWTGVLSNLYQIDVNTSVDAGSDCQPIVKVYVTLPSVTIQIASEFGLL